MNERRSTKWRLNIRQKEQKEKLVFDCKQWDKAYYAKKRGK